MRALRSCLILLAVLSLGVPAGAQTKKPDKPKPLTEAQKLAKIKGLEDRRAPAEDLVKTLDDESAAVRVATARALGRLGDDRALRVLPTLLGDPVAQVRHEAIFAMSRIGKQAGLAALLAATKSTDARDRALAATGLGFIGLLDSKSDEVHRERALEKLGEMLGDGSLRVRQRAALAIGYLKLPDKGIPILAKALEKTADASMRWRLLYSIGRLGTKTAVPHLAKEADNPETTLWCQEFAALYLSRIKTKECAAPLRKLAAARAWMVAANACRGLSKHPGPQTEKTLELALEHPSFHVRAAAVSSLAAIKSTAAVTVLRGMMAGDSSRTVRVASLSALIRLHPAWGLSHVAKMLDDKSTPEYMLRTAAEMIGSLAADGKNPAAVALATKIFEKGAPLVKAEVVSGLGGKAVGKGREIVLSALDSKKDEVFESAIYVLNGDRKSATPEDLLEKLRKIYKRLAGKRKYGFARSYIIQLVSRVENDSVLDDLNNALEDANPTVRKHAAEAIKKRTKKDAPKYEKFARKYVPPKFNMFRKLPRRPVVLIETTKGDIRLELYPEQARAHVRMFVDRVENGGYDGNTFHRVVSSFVIQGGDPTSTGSGDPGFNLRHEINQERYLPGTLGMPRWEDMESGSCQIFITHLPTPHLNGRYTVFGRVTHGMSTVDRIEVGDKIIRARRIR